LLVSRQSVPNPSFLINSIPVLYFSRDIIGSKRADYKRLLAATMKDAWEEWILCMREAVRDTMEWWTAASTLFAIFSIKLRNSDTITLNGTVTIVHKMPNGEWLRSVRCSKL